MKEIIEIDMDEVNFDKMNIEDIAVIAFSKHHSWKSLALDYLCAYYRGQVDLRKIQEGAKK